MLVLLLELVVEVIVFLSDLIDLFSEYLHTFAVVRLSTSGPEFAYPEECVLAAPALSDLPHEAVVPSAVLKFATIIDEE